MNLQKKTALSIGVIAGLLLLFFSFFWQTLLLKPFYEAEKREMARRTEEVLISLRQTIEEFNLRFADWSSWDESYRFVLDNNEAFSKANLNDETLENMRVNLILFIRSSGEAAFRKVYDLEEKKTVPVSTAFLEELVKKNRWFEKIQKKEDAVAGIVDSPQGPLLVAIRPLLQSTDEGPSHGLLIGGRYINESVMERLSELLSLRLKFEPLNSAGLPPDFKAAQSFLRTPSHVEVKSVSGEELAAYTLLPDLEGKPSFILRVANTRETYHQYQKAVTYFFIAILALSILFLILSLFLLDRFILSRLWRLNQMVHQIRTSRDLSICVLTSGKDEIAQLGSSVNEMLERLRQDLNIQKALELKLVQSQKMSAVGQMAAGIAHEIRNPITSIQGYSELGLHKNNPEEVTLKCFTVIRESAKRCGQIVQDLLTFSRMNTNEESLSDLNAVIDEALAVVGIHLKIENIDLVKEYEKNLPKVKLYKSRFQQIMMNLCSNAVDAMEQGGKIIVRTQQAEMEGKKGLKITVRDTGAGIPPEVLSKIFDPFFTTKENGKGTGLGLAMVQEIVEQHHGNISVESEKGKGAAFHITLPLV